MCKSFLNGFLEHKPEEINFNSVNENLSMLDIWSHTITITPTSNLN